MILLAALIFGLITFGFALLTLLPVILGFLAVGVYMEGKAHPAVATSGVPGTTQAPDAVMPAVHEPRSPEAVAWSRSVLLAARE